MEIVKVMILSKCQDCDGQAYLPSGKGVDSRVVEYQRYLPCPTCNDSVKTDKWIILPDFQKLLKELEFPHENVSQTGGYHLSAGNVWADIQKACDDCGKILD